MHTLDAYPILSRKKNKGKETSKHLFCGLFTSVNLTGINIASKTHSIRTWYENEGSVQKESYINLQKITYSSLAPNFYIVNLAFYR